MKNERLPLMVEEKYKKLQDLIRGYGKLLVAYSGGVDSTFLLKVAADVLGGNALGIIGVSPSLPRRELEEALEIARKFRLPCHQLRTEEMEDENYARNPANRCYYCKRELFGKMVAYARRHGYPFIADGTNFDDTGDYRPGQEAARELQVVSPLKDAGLGKTDIRRISHSLGLPTWDKPAYACLSSRFPTGLPITEQALRQVEQAEDVLFALGFRQLRVRHHRQIARIEVGSEEIARFLNPEVRREVAERLREIGYQFVTLDLAGYRQGSLNQLIPAGSSVPEKE